MKALERSVLFAQHKVNGKDVTYPVSVHSNEKTALAHKSMVSAAHKAGNVQGVMALAPKVKLTDTGKLHDNVKFAVVTLPYNPEVEIPETKDDTFEL